MQSVLNRWYLVSRSDCRRASSRVKTMCDLQRWSPKVGHWVVASQCLCLCQWTWNASLHCPRPRPLSFFFIPVLRTLAIAFVKHAPFCLGLFKCLQCPKTLECNFFDWFVFFFCGFIHAPEAHHTQLEPGPPGVMSFGGGGGTSWSTESCQICQWRTQGSRLTYFVLRFAQYCSLECVPHTYDLWNQVSHTACADRRQGLTSASVHKSQDGDERVDMSGSDSRRFT